MENYYLLTEGPPKLSRQSSGIKKPLSVVYRPGYENCPLGRY
jgi:hypothetical protein